MKRTHVTHRLVEHIPEQLEYGILYVSNRFGTAVHKCCCGCGEEVVTPLGATDWILRISNGSVTLTPSIGNWSYACRSHYLIRRNRVIWLGEMTDQAIAMGRDYDRAAKQVHFSGVGQCLRGHTPNTDTIDENQPAGPSLWLRIRRALGRWW